ncbi:hypothetical protein PR202_ga31239 [Eleusine coracana subsp. coracana]|uniref:RING-type domain-containing protein n=1 Tax=Eleusine coracana subsp. coracana TaxID=191504 RepID=A0AAV5DPH1_ELECO|nr:hypothetical protein PR202_ga31239 [Eleusine coracana subsp. coracana]
MDDDGDWITARYLLSSILGRNPLVVDYIDEESFPVEPPPRAQAQVPPSSPPPAVKAPAGVAGTVCAVCTEDIAVADAVARLPCAHWYHHGCIAPWLGIRSTCPLCRAELPPREDDAGEEEEEGGRVKPPSRSSAGGSVVRAPRRRRAVWLSDAAGYRQPEPSRQSRPAAVLRPRPATIETRELETSDWPARSSEIRGCPPWARCSASRRLQYACPPPRP